MLRSTKVAVWGDSSLLKVSAAKVSEVRRTSATPHHVDPVRSPPKKKSQMHLAADAATGVALERVGLKPSTVPWVLAVVRQGEFHLPLLAPNLLPGFLGMQREVRIPLGEVPIDCCLGMVQGFVITVVDD